MEPASNRFGEVVILGYDGQGGVLLSLRVAGAADRDFWIQLPRGVKKLPAGAQLRLEWDDFSVED